MADSAREQPNARPEDDDAAMERDLRRVAHMFSAHRDNPLMRELCRLAIKCAQERLTSG